MVRAHHAVARLAVRVSPGSGTSWIHLCHLVEPFALWPCFLPTAAFIVTAYRALIYKACSHAHCWSCDRHADVWTVSVLGLSIKFHTVGGVVASQVLKFRWATCPLSRPLTQKLTQEARTDRMRIIGNAIDTVYRIRSISSKTLST
ncbi:hypothetical protein BCR37DRAFT_251617 [Protomyces lactucae-debilis]|uniref:Uncharacterized protein n=1 Tax=Protomyces lactucae-debilis TaxID=2754530 RepID=A0A1Y2FMG9_PROLT|nr:uncharacterized protein BCR37DRAFT_251617 [Protomyces lactucae-debilis]ORY84787.1 hypothetical protein BCR37DRAFT_251617 [Protomyces lactucae-debilis]